MEEGLLPHLRSIDDPAQMEEERRLAYVGMTRARERLYLPHALRRFHNGMTRHISRSRFLADIPGRRGRAARRAPALAAAQRARAPRRAGGARMPLRNDIPDTPAVLEPGDRVQHASLRPWRSYLVRHGGGDQHVTVAFEAGVGVKKLALSLAPLSGGVAGLGLRGVLSASRGRRIATRAC